MENVLSKMADSLVRLIILLLFISFRPISSNSVKNQEGKLLKIPFAFAHWSRNVLFGKKSHV